MPIDPITASMLTSAALSFFGGLLGSENNDQTKYVPFHGNIAEQLLNRGTDNTQKWLESLAGLASQPVHLRGAYAQPLPMFGGGGLPMNIGAPAMDPGFVNKNLYDLPGIPGLNFNNVSEMSGPRENPWSGRGYGGAPRPNASGNYFGAPSENGGAGGMGDPYGEAEEVLDMMGIRGGRSMVR